MKVVVFGANGGTGRLVTRQLLDAGHTRGCRHQTTRHIPDQRPAVDGGQVDGVWDADAVANALLGIEPRLF